MSYPGSNLGSDLDICFMTEGQAEELNQQAEQFGPEYFERYFSVRVDYELSHEEAMLVLLTSISGVDCKRLKARGVSIEFLNSVDSEIGELDLDDAEHMLRLELFVELVCRRGLASADAKEAVVAEGDITLEYWSYDMGPGMEEEVEEFYLDREEDPSYQDD